jgi:secreted Zn-dependent insulinase-like peptidase
LRTCFFLNDNICNLTERSCCEADEQIYIYCQYLLKEYPNCNIKILSNDTDLIQCISSNTFINDCLNVCLKSTFDTSTSSIPNYNTPRPTVSPDAYGPEETSKLVELVPIKDLKTLELHFSFPPTEMLYKEKPNRYLSHLIGHEGNFSGIVINYIIMIFSPLQ